MSIPGKKKRPIFCMSANLACLAATLKGRRASKHDHVLICGRRQEQEVMMYERSRKISSFSCSEGVTLQRIDAER